MEDVTNQFIQSSSLGLIQLLDGLLLKIKKKIKTNCRLFKRERKNGQ